MCDPVSKPRKMAGLKVKYGQENLVLLGVGLCLLMVAPLYARMLPAGSRLLEAALAAEIALAVTIVLWSLFPKPTAMTGTFGLTKLIGPAALGVMLLFWFWRTEGPQLYLVEKGQNGIRIGLNRLVVVDVSTLPDKRLCGRISDLRSSLWGDELAVAFQKVANAHGVPGEKNEVMNLVKECVAATSDAHGPIDAKWIKLLHTADGALAKRLDREPFAVLSVNGLIELVTPGSSVERLSSLTVRVISAYSKHRGGKDTPAVIFEAH
jgi:hypothetical protein